MPSTAQHLRNRAWRARAIADRLDTAPLHSLDSYAGPDTWQCPAAEEFLLSVLCYQQRLLGAAEELRWEAYQLELRAEEHEASEAAAAAAAIVAT